MHGFLSGGPGLRRAGPTLAAVALLAGGVGTACHPPVPPAADPSAECARGWEQFRLGEYDAAVAAFQAVEAGTPGGGGLHAAALYGEATVWNLRRPDDDRSRARALYEQIAADPHGDLAAWSLLDLAAMRYPATADVEPDWDAIVQGYQQVIDRFPDSLAAEEAFMTQQSVVLRRSDPSKTREALARLEGFAASHPDSRFLYAALLLAGSGYETLGQWRETVGARIRAAQSVETPDQGGRAAAPNLGVNSLTNYWTIASVSEFQLGDFATAREYYGRIVARAPADPLYGSALVALQRMDAQEAAARREVSVAP